MNSKNINILHSVSSFPQGGLEKLLLYFLKASGKDYTVVIMNDEVDEYLGQELVKTGLKVYFLNKKEGNKHPKYLFRLLKIIKEHRIDVIHTHDVGSMMWSVLCKFFKPGLKLAYTIHSAPDVKSWDKATLFINRNFIDMNIAISTGILNDCVSNRLKVTKIYNGVDIKRFKPAQGSASIFSIINVARITYYIKGLDILIQALKECKDKGMKFICNLVGGPAEGDKHSMEFLEKLIDGFDLTDEIKFWGNREDVPDLLVQSDVFVLPSRIEGLPVALLEAMSAKLPVIASNISGSVELVEHGKNGLLFENENHADLAEKILFLYHHREEMKRLAQNAYEYVQGFDISVMCEKYWDLYESLVK